jgi:hypothetical protein
MFANPAELDLRDRRALDELEQRHMPFVTAVRSAPNEESAYRLVGEYAEKLDQDPETSDKDRRLVEWFDLLIAAYVQSNSRGLRQR